MAKEIRLHAEAQVELADSVAFYRERGGEQIAEQFKKRIEESLRSIVAGPTQYPLVKPFRNLQKCRVQQFPFSILFIEQTERIWVVAVAHGSRKPRYWKGRLA